MLATAPTVVRTPTYNKGLYIVRTDKWQELERKIANEFHPITDLGKLIKLCFPHLPLDLAQELFDAATRSVIMQTEFSFVVTRPPHSEYNDTDRVLIEDHGIVSRRKVTTAGVTALCVAWGNAAFNAIYMALGTNNTAESNAHTGLQTEIAASHYTGSVRPTCTHVESSNTVPLVGSHTHATSGDTIEEHGVFTSATQGAVTLWDRHLTGTTALAVGDGLTGTLTLTCSAEA